MAEFSLRKWPGDMLELAFRPTRFYRGRKSGGFEQALMFAVLAVGLSAILNMLGTFVTYKTYGRAIEVLGASSLKMLSVRMTGYRTLISGFGGVAFFAAVAHLVLRFYGFSDWRETSRIYLYATGIFPFSAGASLVFSFSGYGTVLGLLTGAVFFLYSFYIQYTGLRQVRDVGRKTGLLTVFAPFILLAGLVILFLVIIGLAGILLSPQ